MVKRCKERVERRKMEEHVEKWFGLMSWGCVKSVVVELMKPEKVRKLLEGSECQ